MSAHRVLVADPIAEKGIELLQEAEGIEVDVKLGLSESELVDLAPNYAGIIVRSGVKITAPVIEAGSGVLKAIGRAGVGVDNIDIPVATQHGVVVMNTPSGNTISTAEHAFTLMMSLARNIPHAHRSVVEDRFKEGRKAYKGVELYNKTLAILGMGRIGAEFAKRAQGFGMKVVAYDPYLGEAKAESLRVGLCETVEEAVKQADFITLHMPKTPETTHILNAERFDMMKPGVRIVNCARGGLIDEEALLAALDAGKISGVALDVFEVEPPAADNPLLGREDVVFTPHLGASTEEAQENVGIEIAEAIRDQLLHGTVLNAVNMPNLDESTLREIGGYLDIASLLGALAGQLAPQQPDLFRIEYEGNVSNIDTTLITRSALKGFLDIGATSGSANYLNAPALAEERGVRVTESRPADESEYTELMTVTVGNGKETASVSGTFFGAEARIVKVQQHHIDASPTGHLILVENTDAPGIVGSVGSILGDAGINIASMSLSRGIVEGKALSIINLDSAPAAEVLSALEGVPGVLGIRAVSL